MSKEEDIEQAIEQRAKELYAEMLLNTDKHYLEDVQTDLKTALNNFINIEQPIYVEVIAAVKEDNYTEAAQIIQNDSYERQLFVDTLNIDELMYGELYRNDASNLVNEDDFIDDEDVSLDTSPNDFSLHEDHDNLDVKQCDITVLQGDDIKNLMDGLNARKIFYEHLSNHQDIDNISLDESVKYWERFDKLFDDVQNFDDKTPDCNDFVNMVLPEDAIEACERIKTEASNMENLSEMLKKAQAYYIPVFDDNHDERSLINLSLPSLKKLHEAVKSNAMELRELSERYGKKLKKNIQR